MIFNFFLCLLLCSFGFTNAKRRVLKSGSAPVLTSGPGYYCGSVIAAPGYKPNNLYYFPYIGSPGSDLGQCPNRCVVGPPGTSDYVSNLLFY
ncbi:uncharacterized protein VTP21DRAFT_4280 [Calcarisporiella thermophila]|uniref:uncharacterized protein n=1 Tax=Calcarisporiella thermophila TaxID=911321 RepID=UPI0037426E7D